MPRGNLQARPDIAVLMPSYVAGGAEAVGFFVAEQLAAAGLKVDLVVARGHGGLKDLHVDGVCKVDLKAPTELLCLPQWLSYLGRRQPRCAMTLIHTANLTGGLGALFRPDIPVIAAFHNSIVRPPADQWFFRRLFGCGPERRLYRRMARMVAVSDGLADEVARVFERPRDDVLAVPNAPLAPDDHDTPVEPRHASLFTKPVVLGVGRLAPQKDFATLIKAFASIAGAHPADLVILGEGEARRRLEALAGSLGLAERVHLPGRVDAPSRYMRRAEVVAISSRYEGFSLVCVEALASGAKIVSTDCDHGPREILDGGRFGRLTPVGDATALGRALLDALEDRREDNAARRAERADQLENYRRDRMARRYEALVRAVLAGKTVREPGAVTVA